MTNETDNTLNAASSIAGTTYAKDFGKHVKGMDAAADGLANYLLENEVDPKYLSIDKYSDSNPVQMEVMHQIAEGRLTKKRAANVKLTGKKEIEALSDADKKQRDSDRKQCRRLTISFLTTVYYKMLPQEVREAAESKAGKRADRTEWHVDEKRMAALKALHDSASGTDKAPQQQYELEFQQLLKPAIDFLRSKSGVAKKVHDGYGQQYTGSFSIKKKQ